MNESATVQVDMPQYRHSEGKLGNQSSAVQAVTINAGRSCINVSSQLLMQVIVDKHILCLVGLKTSALCFSYLVRSTDGIRLAEEVYAVQVKAVSDGRESKPTTCPDLIDYQLGGYEISSVSEIEIVKSLNSRF